ncbi:hypothetical protein SAMN05444166_0218 [Singulisphaera sp. GP187]|uniref:hypothetical protein n=1 Tax=Singulisphaera sp. GP187 TaxID=1882752 RepID=UPI00092B78DA|nr:hypothetical protein [Singulisphaera sp. GP187]SIN69922.1 hypothetical protein SAMN05444166_0218 [Singulisphaera sp. GP187]
MRYWGNASPEQLEAYKAVVLAFLAERGPIPRADIWQSLDGRVSVGHVDRSLKALLNEGRISVTRARFTKPVAGPWPPGKVVTYTASIYSVVRHDG